MKLILSLLLVLSASSSWAIPRKMICVNPATKAALRLQWDSQNQLSGFVQFNVQLSQILYSQGVEFPEGAYWGRAIEDGSSFFFTDYQPQTPVTNSQVDIRTQNNGLLVAYTSPKKRAIANFFFNPGECRVN